MAQVDTSAEFHASQVTLRDVLTVSITHQQGPTEVVGDKVL